MKNNMFLTYLFLMVGLMNIISLLDILFSERNISYTIFSFPTSKEINIAFYAILSILLFYAGIGQYRRINEKLKNQDDKLKTKRIDHFNK